LSEQYVLSEPHQMAVCYCLFTDYCLLIILNPLSIGYISGEALLQLE